jgi:GNAT superfamily N-acetyltransferase
MITDFNFRAMSEEEISSVANLISKAMDEDKGKWAYETIRFHFLCKKNDFNDGREYFVAEKNNTIIGVIGLHRYIWGPRETSWLGWFAVLPEYQGQKVGFNLMKRIIERARSQGYQRLFIETYSEEAFGKARNFYKHFGFQEMGTIKDYFRQGDDMIVFGLNL